MIRFLTVTNCLGVNLRCLRSPSDRQVQQKVAARVSGTEPQRHYGTLGLSLRPNAHQGQIIPLCELGLGNSWGHFRLPDDCRCFVACGSAHESAQAAGKLQQKAAARVSGTEPTASSRDVMIEASALTPFPGPSLTPVCWELAPVVIGWGHFSMLGHSG